MSESTKSNQGKPGRAREYSPDRKQTQLRLEPEVRAALDRYRQDHGQALQACLERIVVRFLESEGYLEKKKPK